MPAMLIGLNKMPQILFMAARTRGVAPPGGGVTALRQPAAASAALSTTVALSTTKDGPVHLAMSSGEPWRRLPRPSRRRGCGGCYVPGGTASDCEGLAAPATYMDGDDDAKPASALLALLGRPWRRRRGGSEGCPTGSPHGGGSTGHPSWSPRPAVRGACLAGKQAGHGPSSTSHRTEYHPLQPGQRVSTAPPQEKLRQIEQRGGKRSPSLMASRRPLCGRPRRAPPARQPARSPLNPMVVISVKTVIPREGFTTNDLKNT